MTARLLGSTGRRVAAATSVVALLATAMTLAGCWQGKEEQPKAMAQDQICVTAEVRVESGCNPGQRVVFMPGSWGNEQLPVMFAAMNCDLRYTVVMTNGGVTCVFLKARQPDGAEPAASEAASAAKSGG